MCVEVSVFLVSLILVIICTFIPCKLLITYAFVLLMAFLYFLYKVDISNVCVGCSYSLLLVCQSEQTVR